MARCICTASEIRHPIPKSTRRRAIGPETIAIKFNIKRPCTILREKMEKANIEEQRLEALTAAREQLTLIIISLLIA